MKRTEGQENGVRSNARGKESNGEASNPVGKDEKRVIEKSMGKVETARKNIDEDGREEKPGVITITQTVKSTKNKEKKS